MSITQKLRRLIPKTRRGRLRVLFYGTLVLVPAMDMLYVRWQRHIPLGRDTTYIDAPLKANGYPDYVAWLNKKRGEGVKPEENAAVALMEMTVVSKEDKYYKGLRAAWGLPPDTTPRTFKTPYEFVREKMPGASEETLEKADAEIGISQDRTDRLAPWLGAGNPLAKEWLDASAPWLAAFHAAVQRPKYFMPILREDGSVPDSLREVDRYADSIYRYISTALRAVNGRIGARAAAGDGASACDDLLDMYRFALLMCVEDENRGWFRLNAWTVLSITSVLPPAEARRLLRQMPAVPAPQVTNANIERDRLVELERVQFLATHDFATFQRTLPYGSDPPWKDEIYFVAPRLSTATALLLPVPYAKISRDINGWYDEAEQFSRLPPHASRERARPRMKEVRAEVEKAGMGYRAVMRIVAVPYFYYEGDWEAREADGLARLALALRVHRAERGSFPESLNGLAEGLLSSIPIQYRTGQPWRYERQGDGYAIYGISRTGEPGKEPIMQQPSPDARVKFQALNY